MRLRIILAIVIGICAAVYAWSYHQEQQVKRGEQAFQEAGCPACHLSGGAPSLQNVAKQMDRRKMRQFILDPDSVYRERGNQSFNVGYPRMPKPGVNDRDVDAIVSYLQSLKD